ncbi:hypothetical protein OAX71_05050 [Pseudomonadales bacterium]|nr:hypothetical protein [Pseudomonadales bacterium]
MAFYLFAFGFFIAFEQIVCSLVINSLSLGENSRDITSGPRGELLLTLWIFFSITLVVLFTNRSFTDSYSIESLIFIAICLWISLWAYLKVMVTVCALELNDHVIYNRLFKLLGEVAFIGLFTILLLFEPKVEVAIASYAASILFMLYLARRTLTRREINIKFETPINYKSPISKQYWPQLTVQGINVFAHSLPMIVLSHSALPAQIAFYFVAAQLYQIGPMLVHPILTAQYPRLRLERGEYDFSFFKLSVSSLAIIAVIYTVIYMLMPTILAIWTGGKVITDQQLLFFLHLISIIAIVHNCLKYFIISKDMSDDLFSLYLVASGFALASCVAFLLIESLIMAAFSFTISFEILAVIFVIRKILVRNKLNAPHKK